MLLLPQRKMLIVERHLSRMGNLDVFPVRQRHLNFMQCLNKVLIKNDRTFNSRLTVTMWPLVVIARFSLKGAYKKDGNQPGLLIRQEYNLKVGRLHEVLRCTFYIYKPDISQIKEYWLKTMDPTLQKDQGIEYPETCASNLLQL